MASIEFPLSFSRQYPGPLDVSAVFSSLTDLNTYVSSNPIAYSGQVVSVSDVNDAGIYMIADDPSNPGSFILTTALVDQDSLDLKADQSTTYTKGEVDTKVADLVDSAPETLDTLNELAAALGDDPNFATTVTNSIGTKADQATTYTKTEVDVHTNDTNNPHSVTKSQLGLSSVENIALSTWTGSNNITTLGTLSQLTVDGQTTFTNNYPKVGIATDPTDDDHLVSKAYADGLNPSGTLSVDTGAVKLLNEPVEGNVAGSSRGDYSVDLQASRDNANEVAGGANSSILGGQNNKITSTGSESCIVGGSRNTVTNSRAIILGGDDNIASGAGSEVLGSSLSKALQMGSTIVGGSDSICNANWAIIAGGLSSKLGDFTEDVDGNPLLPVSPTTSNAGKRSAILGGNNHYLKHFDSVILGGTGIVSDADNTVFVPSLNVKDTFILRDDNVDNYALRSDASGVGTWQEVVSNDSYAPAWALEETVSPSKASVYDKIQQLILDSGGSTNLSIGSVTSSSVVVASDTGTDATITLADSSGNLAGLLSGTDAGKLSNISVTQAVDLDTLETAVSSNTSKLSNISVTQAVDLDALETAVSSNTSKLTADETNVLAALNGASITDAGTPATDDKVLIQDVSDGDEIKYVNISDLTSGAGNVTKVGTPLDNQIAVWTGDGTLEGESQITYDGTTLDVTGNISVSGTVDGRDVATDGAKLDTITGTNTGDEAGASLTIAGVVELATSAEINDGSGSTGSLAITPFYLKNSGYYSDRVTNNAKLTADETNVLAALNGASITDAGTPATDDKVLIQDTSDSNNLKYVNISELATGGSGDMLKATYDPTNVNADAFSMGNMVEASDKNILTDAERDKLGNFWVGDNNLSATSDPGTTDDSSGGYSVGSIWINTSSEEVYRCVDSTVGSSVWVQSSLSSLEPIATSGSATDLTSGILNIDRLSNNSIISGKLSSSVRDSLVKADSSLQTSDVGVTLQGYTSVLQNTTESYVTIDKEKIDYISVTQLVDLDALETAVASNASKVSADGSVTTHSDITSAGSGSIITSVERSKIGNISVTQPVDLDDLEDRISNLDATVVLKGTWDASSGSFPASTLAGFSYIVSTAGTVDSISFDINDRLISLVDGASTSVYGSNWYKADYTDQVLTVNTLSGNVILATDDISDSGQTNKYTDAAGVAKLSNIAVTQAVDLDALETAVTSNTNKITNATHTGEVTGSGQLVLQSSSITNRTSLTSGNLSSDDLILVSDTSESSDLKKVTAQDVADLAKSTPGLNTSVQTLSSSLSSVTLDVSNGMNGRITLTEDVNSLTISNLSDGDTGMIFIKQNSTGGYVFNVSTPSQRVYSGDLASIPNITSNSVGSATVGYAYDSGEVYLYVSEVT